MLRVGVPLTTSYRKVEWYQVLAGAVIQLAIVDGDEAFFSDFDGEWWCEVAGLDVERVVALAHRSRVRTRHPYCSLAHRLD